MTLDELQSIVAKELKVNDEKLDSESLKNQELYAKYLEHKSRFELLSHKARADYKRVYKEKWEYYGGKSDAKVYASKPFDLKVLKADVHIYMDSDDELQRADQKAAYLKQVVNYLEQVLRSINNRTFLIKNAIEWKKFTSGAI